MQPGLSFCRWNSFRKVVRFCGEGNVVGERHDGWSLVWCISRFHRVEFCHPDKTGERGSAR